MKGRPLASAPRPVMSASVSPMAMSVLSVQGSSLYMLVLPHAMRWMMIDTPATSPATKSASWGLVAFEVYVECKNEACGYDYPDSCLQDDICHYIVIAHYVILRFALSICSRVSSSPSAWPVGSGMLTL